MVPFWVIQNGLWPYLVNFRVDLCQEWLKLGHYFQLWYTDWQWQLLGNCWPTFFVAVDELCTKPGKGPHKQRRDAVSIWPTCMPQPSEMWSKTAQHQGSECRSVQSMASLRTWAVVGISAFQRMRFWGVWKDSRKFLEILFYKCIFWCILAYTHFEAASEILLWNSSKSIMFLRLTSFYEANNFSFPFMDFICAMWASDTVAMYINLNHRQINKVSSCQTSDDTTDCTIWLWRIAHDSRSLVLMYRASLCLLLFWRIVLVYTCSIQLVMFYRAAYWLNEGCIATADWSIECL